MSDVFHYNDFDDDFYCCLCYTYDPYALHTAKISHAFVPFKRNGKKKKKWLTFGNRHDAGDGVLVSHRGIGCCHGASWCGLSDDSCLIDDDPFCSTGLFFPQDCSDFLNIQWIIAYFYHN